MAVLLVCRIALPSHSPHLHGHADVPTYSLKGIPGISAITGSDAPPPSDLGVIGRGTDGSKPGVRARALDKHPI